MTHYSDTELASMYERSKFDHCAWVGSEIRCLIADIREARSQATLSASPVAQEPVAWLRNLVGAECKPDGRCYDICFADPKDDRYRALYTSPPATPAAPVAQEPVAIKLLEWRDRGPAVHPQWEAVSVVGSYFIATIKGGQFNWWTTALRGKIEQHSLNDAKDAAQADYEKRIRSALSNPPATSAGVEIVKLVEEYSRGAFTGWKGKTGNSKITLDQAEDHFSLCVLDLRDAILALLSRTSPDKSQT